MREENIVTEIRRGDTFRGQIIRTAEGQMRIRVLWNNDVLRWEHIASGDQDEADVKLSALMNEVYKEISAKNTPKMRNSI